MAKREQLTDSNTRGRFGLSRRDVLVNAALIGAGIALGPAWLPRAPIRPGTLATGATKRALAEETK